MGKVKVNKKSFMFAFLILPFFRPLGLEVKTFRFLYPLFTYWELLILGVFAIIFVISCRSCRIRNSNYSIFIYLYTLYTLVQSIVCKVSQGRQSVIPLFSVLFFCLGTVVVLYVAKKDIVQLVDFFYGYFGIINVCNLIFYAVPALNKLLGDEWYYFCGHRQSLPMLWSMSVFVGLLKYNYYDKRDRHPLFMIVYILIPSFMMLISGVGTGIVALVVFVGLYFLVFLRNKLNAITTFQLRIIYIVGLLFNWLLVSVNIQTRFTTLISYYLHETVTFNGRTVIWDAFLKAVKKSPIWGYGFNGIRVATGWGGGWDNLDYAHNTILQELSNGGIVGFVLFFLMGYVALKSIDKLQNIDYKKIVLCVLGSQLVIMCSESISYYQYYSLFVALLANLPSLDRERNAIKI